MSLAFALIAAGLTRQHGNRRGGIGWKIGKAGEDYVSNPLGVVGSFMAG